MQVTVITLYHGRDCELFVGVVQGSLSKEQRQQWRDQYGIVESDDERDEMYFRDCDLIPEGVHPENAPGLKNADDEAYPERIPD